MDHFKANQLANQLIGKTFQNCRILKLVNNGKSAAVFLAESNDGKQVALKIFDNDIIERYGQEIQHHRIEQEIALKGHRIPNLINILDGGKQEIEETDYFFIIMDYVHGLNLKQYIETKEYDPNFVKKVALTLFEVTERLLEEGIAHRDIKPENIMINSVGEIILMDLGVLKLIGEPSASDVKQKQFLGTLIYAPPEYLTRKETNDIDGWRAVNYYQIGAVMHDLIMKKEMFSAVSPYANVVIAIKEDAPEVTSTFYPYETIQLTRDLLTKDPQVRLKLTPKTRITEWASKSDGNSDDISKEIEGLLQMTSSHKAKIQEIENIARSTKERREIRVKISQKIEELMTGCFKRLKEIGGCYQWRCYDNFYFTSDHPLLKDKEIRNLLFELRGDLETGFSQPLYMLVRFENNERSEAVVRLLGVLLTQMFPKNNHFSPLDVFHQLDSEKPKLVSQLNQVRVAKPPINFNFQTLELFNGTIGFDHQLEDMLLVTILKVVKKAIKLMEPDVIFQLSIQERVAKGESAAYTRGVNPKSKLIYDLDN